AARGRAAQGRLPRALGGRVAERARRPGPGGGAADRRVRGRGGEGAGAASRRGRVVPAARAARRRRRALGRAQRGDRARARGRGAARGQARAVSARFPGAAQAGTDARGLPAPARHGAEAPARIAARWSGDGHGRRPLYTRAMPARVYAVANQKGGVGKTTTAVNLAACLAEAGERALLIDLDPQANATSGLGLRANGTSAHDLLDGVPLDRLAKPSPFPNLDVVPAKADLAGAAVELSLRAGGERYLAEMLQESALAPYSFVFLDCPPAFGPLTVNAL